MDLIAINSKNSIAVPEQIDAPITVTESESQGNHIVNVSESTEATVSNKPEIKHSLVYVANGDWKDKNGVVWCRDNRHGISELVLNDTEYAGRSDIQFVVQYGMMKNIIIR